MEYILLIIGIAIALFIFWAEILYYLAGKNKQILFGIIFSFGIFSTAIQTILKIVTAKEVYIFLLSSLFALFVIFWGHTLYEQAGNKEKRWYYLTLIISPLSIVYKFVSDN